MSTPACDPANESVWKLSLQGERAELFVPSKSILYDIYGGTWVYLKTGEHSFERQRVLVRSTDGATGGAGRRSATGHRRGGRRCSRVVRHRVWSRKMSWLIEASSATARVGRGPRDCPDRGRRTLSRQGSAGCLSRSSRPPWWRSRRKCLAFPQKRSRAW